MKCFPVTVAMLGIALTGCVGASPPSDSSRLLPSRGGVVGGYTTRNGSLFGPFVSLNDDCSVQAYARIRIIQKPAHGVARVIVRDGQATFQANNSMARCNGAPIKGPFVDYTPDSGYSGPDRFRFELVFRDGEKRVLTPDFTVSAAR